MVSAVLAAVVRADGPETEPAAAGGALIEVEASGREGEGRLRWHDDDVRRVSRERREVRVRALPLPGAESVDATLRPMPVVTPRTRFVLGDLDRGDQPLTLATPPVVLSGGVDGRPDSLAVMVLAIRPRGRSRGLIEVGGRRFALHASPGGEEQLQVVDAHHSQPPGDTPWCGFVNEELSFPGRSRAPRPGPF